MGEKSAALRPIPVSRLATERALSRLTIGSKTDVPRYRKYQSRVQATQPEFIPGLRLLGMAKVALFGHRGFQEHAYMGGGFFYLAAVEEQAKLNRQELPRFRQADFHDVMTEDIVAVAGMGFVHDLQAMFQNELPDEALQEVAEAPVHDLAEVMERYRHFHPGMLSDSPFAETNRQIFEQSEAVGKDAIAKRLSQFTTGEEAYVTTMGERWWKDMPPESGAAQVMGAADAQAGIQRYYERATSGGD